MGQRQRIIIDAGHSRQSPGADGGSVNEYFLNLDYAKSIKYVLHNAGFDVKMTRTADSLPSDSDKHTRLQKRAANANARDIFISVHFDWVSGKPAVYYPPGREQSKRLASLIADHLQSDCVPGQDKRVLTSTASDCHSVLIEIATVDKASNTREDRLMVAQGVYVAIKQFLGI